MHNFELIDLDREATPDVPPALADSPMVIAENDVELARAFLQHGVLARSTLKSTKTELSRFLWWCRDREFRLSDLGVEDMVAYRDFLLDPQPREKWVSAGGTRWPRNDPRWRPFSGQLSSQSARQAFRVALALTAFARDSGFSNRDPGALVQNFPVVRHAKTLLYLDSAAAAYVESICTVSRPDGCDARAAAREHFLLVVFVTTGARLSEIAQASMSAIQADQDGRWWLKVTSVGQKARRLPVSAKLLACYQEYRRSFGLPRAPQKGENIPLVLSLRRRKPTGISPEAIANAMTGLFAQAAERAGIDGKGDTARDLLEASLNWARHEIHTTVVGAMGD